MDTIDKSVAGAAATTAPPAEPQAIAPADAAEIRLALPQGSTADQAHLDALTSFAKERGLSQDIAQAMLERDLAGMKAHQERQTQELASLQEQQLTTHQETWERAALADKGLVAADGTLTASLDVARKALGHFDTSGEMHQFLDASRLGSNPVVLRFLKRVGEALGGDGRLTAAPVETKDVLYPSMSRNAPASAPAPTNPIANLFYPNMRKP